MRSSTAIYPFLASWANTSIEELNNIIREESLKGRNPGPQGPKVSNGSDKLDVEVKKSEEVMKNYLKELRYE